MPKSLPARCRDCGKRRLDGWHISRTGLCHTCGNARLTAALERQAEVSRLVNEQAHSAPPGGG